MSPGGFTVEVPPPGTGFVAVMPIEFAVATSDAEDLNLKLARGSVECSRARRSHSNMTNVTPLELD